MSGFPKACCSKVDGPSPPWVEPPSARARARQLRAERRLRRQQSLPRPHECVEPSEPRAKESIDRWHAWIEHRDMLYRRCLGWTGGNVTEAEDLLGQLLMRLLRIENAEFERLQCPRAWMTRVLRHLYVDLVRGNSRAHAHDTEIERVLHGRSSRDPAAEVWRGELSVALRDAIDALPSALRGPLVQRHIEGLDYQQIARSHDITLPTARKRCQLARDRIRQTLQTTISQT